MNTIMRSLVVSALVVGLGACTTGGAGGSGGGSSEGGGNSASCGDR